MGGIRQALSCALAACRCQSRTRRRSPRR